MSYAKWVGIGVLVLLTAGESFAQQTAPITNSSQKYRAIFTPAGAAGGFTAGLFIGLAKFDDAINSDKKVTTTALVGAAAGGIGGYFVGKIFDKRRDRSRAQGVTRSLNVAPLLSSETKGVHVAISF